jgi:hypothetical protein
MHPKFRMTLVLAFGILCGIAPCIWAANTPGPLPSATVVAPESAPTTYYIRDMHDRMLTVEVPALGSPDLKVSDPVRGTVGATVIAVDGQTHQARLRTQEGQILVLDLPPEAVMGMRVGDQFTLSIAQ